jgi:pyruvate/oxaloacetate carboxyltransferase
VLKREEGITGGRLEQPGVYISNLTAEKQNMPLRTLTFQVSLLDADVTYVSKVIPVSYFQILGSTFSNRYDESGVKLKVYTNELQTQINKKFRELKARSMEEVNGRLIEFEKLRKRIAESLVPNWQSILSELEEEAEE